ncbi:MAG: GFA family protein [Pseudomonadota bacterium]
MAETFTGGCKCGRVTYRGTRAETAMFRCYCRDCQQLTGAGHAEMVPLRAEGFEITGSYRTYQMTGGSGQATWSGFCGVCGAPLTRRSARNAGTIYVHAGSLHDPGRYAPERQICEDSAQPWDRPTR